MHSNSNKNVEEIPNLNKIMNFGQTLTHTHKLQHTHTRTPIIKYAPSSMPLITTCYGVWTLTFVNFGMKMNFLSIDSFLQIVFSLEDWSQCYTLDSFLSRLN